MEKEFNDLTTLEIYQNSKALEAVGRPISGKNQTLIREAVLLLNKVLKGTVKKAGFTLTADGLKIQGGSDIPRTVGDIIVTEKGLELVSEETPHKISEIFAGERLGAILERKRTSLGFSVDSIAEDLPIRARVYDRIEAGVNPRPPDDILEAIAKKLKLKFDDLVDTADLDASDPVERFF